MPARQRSAGPGQRREANHRSGSQTDRSKWIAVRGGEGRCRTSASACRINRNLNPSRRLRAPLLEQPELRAPAYDASLVVPPSPFRLFAFRVTDDREREHQAHDARCERERRLCRREAARTCDEAERKQQQDYPALPRDGQPLSPSVAFRREPDLPVGRGHVRSGSVIVACSLVTYRKNRHGMAAVDGSLVRCIVDHDALARKSADRRDAIRSASAIAAPMLSSRPPKPASSSEIHP
ncbi:hypothetical protein UA18_01422 [Burkholderia multivorans]|uniref:Uncharacterized protein n=1 Tax=Burkholderia multivorans TaxID=87883 RepID=A0ABD7LI16_9BURK|nr:hypothetical protein UA18_01422 [Burkholderia multivorans]SAK18255.1 hypothetical protein UA17_01568 [Burkholderia multivorans]